jgi:hypothetical protein
MNPINNSDTAWLVVSDYNQENNLSYEELRKDILNPEINQWYWEWRFRDMCMVGGILGVDYDCVGFNNGQHRTFCIVKGGHVGNYDSDGLFVGGNAINTPDFA